MAQNKALPADDCTKDMEGSGGVMKEDIDEAESGYALESLHFASMKEKPHNGIVLTEGTFEGSDSTQDWDGFGGVTEKNLDETKNDCELENPFLVTVKEEPYDETSSNEDPFETSDSTEDSDDCGGVVEKDLDEAKSSNELENPLFVTVKEEPHDETSLDEDTFDENDSAQGSIEGTDRLQRDACTALVGTDMGAGKSVDKNSEKSLKKDGVAGSQKKQRCPSLTTASEQISQSLSKKKLYECSQCKKKFRKKLYVSYHMRIHTGEKPYKCNNCEKAFNQKGSLIAHIRTHTGEKPFHCNLCGKAFTENSHLTAHKRQHTGNKPYKCNHCESAFSRNGDLTVHMRNHTGKKLHVCHECGSAFSRSSVLNVHRRTHSGEKPFKCNQCGRAYTRSHLLTRHARKH